MRALADCPSTVECVGREWIGSLRERKGGVALDVSSPEPFALHLLDDANLMGPGEKCDGVLLAGGPPGLACFIELKGAIDPEDPEHPFRQVRAGIEHFVPQPDGTAHGESHHAAWRSGIDLPQAPRGRRATRALDIAADHAVAGAVVVSRGGTRHKPQWLDVGGRTVFVAVIQKHGKSGRVAITVEDIAGAVL